MKITTFRIRRRIIQAFLFCVLAIVIFAGLSFQAHREMGRHLKLVERADDLVNNILEIRRFEKNFFLYQKPGSLQEARVYLKRVESGWVRNPFSPGFSRAIGSAVSWPEGRPRFWLCANLILGYNGEKLLILFLEGGSHG